eukprot:scaffold93067_cov66-Phaeocystis_antarctica.AAC.1
MQQALRRRQARFGSCCKVGEGGVALQQASERHSCASEQAVGMVERKTVEAECRVRFVLGQGSTPRCCTQPGPRLAPAPRAGASQGLIPVIPNLHLGVSKRLDRGLLFQAQLCPHLVLSESGVLLCKRLGYEREHLRWKRVERARFLRQCSPERSELAVKLPDLPAKERLAVGYRTETSRHSTHRDEGLQPGAPCWQRRGLCVSCALVLFPARLRRHTTHTRVPPH